MGLLYKKSVEIDPGEITRYPLEPLFELAAILENQNDFRETVRLVTEKARSLLQSDVAMVMMINPQTRQTIKTIFSEGASRDQQAYHFAQTNISGWVIENDRPFRSEQLQTDTRFRRDLFKESPIRTAVCVPLRAEGIIIGTLLLLNHGIEEIFHETDLTFLEKLATITAPFLHNVHKIQEYFAPPFSKETLLETYASLGLLGRSQKFLELLRAIEAAARCDVRVLLEGETGTGKELISRAIHRQSSRAGHAFVAIDCGAIPHHLMESELFGHVKGAFTGATNDKHDLFEMADGGTLFIDEVTNLSLEMQAKLLRVLQEGEIRRLGDTKSRPVDVRILSATGTPLRELVNKKEFRKDLYYRLHVYPIRVPSLEERRDDIPLLAHHFLQKFNAEQSKQLESIEDGLLEHLKNLPWKGNIRELENLMERMVTLASPGAGILGMNRLPKKTLGNSQHESSSKDKSLHQMVADYEARIIVETLQAHHWNQSGAARALNIAESSLRFKMAKLGIEHPNPSEK